jgi:dephospho-CoA kinase
MTYFKRQQSKICDVEDAVTTASLAKSSSAPLMDVPHFDEYNHDALNELSEKPGYNANMNIKTFENPDKILSRVKDDNDLSNSILNIILEKTGYITNTESEYKKIYLNSSCEDYKLEKINTNNNTRSKITQPLLIGLTGNIGSGKSTVAEMLFKNFTELTFSEPLKTIAEIFGFPDHDLYGTQADKTKVNKELGISAREFMQKFGTEICRNAIPEIMPNLKIGDSVWVNYLERRLNNISCMCIPENAYDKDNFVCTCGGVNVVVSDCRFLNEANLIREYGGYIIKLERPAARTAARTAANTEELAESNINSNNLVSDHASETSINIIRPDYVILNNGSLEKLELSLNSVLNDIRQYHDFDSKDDEDEEDDIEDNTANKILFIAFLLCNAGLLGFAVNNYDVWLHALLINMLLMLSYIFKDKFINKFSFPNFNFKVDSESESESESESNSDNANTANAKLDNANTANAKLDNANTANAKLDTANAKLDNANTANAKLDNANTANAKLDNANTANAKLDNANTANAKLDSVILMNNIFISLYALFTVFLLYTYRDKQYNIENYLVLNYILMNYYYITTQNKLSNVKNMYEFMQIEDVPNDSFANPTSYYIMISLNVAITLSSCFAYYFLFIVKN